jgi:hypothetical protein
MAQATASYWVVVQDAQGNVSQWMWNCEVCPAANLATTEADVVAGMNRHIETAHPDHDYEAPPIPGEVS